MTRRSPIGKGFDYRAYAKEKAEKQAAEERECLEARAYQQYERELAAKENPKDPGWAGLDKDPAKYRSRELALADANSAERAAAAKYARRVAEAFDLTPATERIFALLCAATEIPKKPQTPGWADFQPSSIPARTTPRRALGGRMPTKPTAIVAAMVAARATPITTSPTRID
jgi:hypothetical protein